MNTSALKQNNDPAETVPKSSGGWKWKNFLKYIWKDKSKFEGQGIGRTIIIPSNTDALTDRLELLLESREAGNIGVRNEIISICDELLLQGEMKKSDYKN